MAIREREEIADLENRRADPGSTGKGDSRRFAAQSSRPPTKFRLWQRHQPYIPSSAGYLNGRRWRIFKPTKRSHRIGGLSNGLVRGVAESRLPLLEFREIVAGRRTKSCRHLESVGVQLSKDEGSSSSRPIYAGLLYLILLRGTLLDSATVGRLGNKLDGLLNESFAVQTDNRIESSPQCL